jgi:UDP-N-acetylglucosamine transferase subunit ALG13
MIFVTVGTDNHQFNRLLEEIDNLIKEGKIKEKVIAQIGYSTYEPKYYKYFRFAPFKKILELNRKARIIISHAGAGSIITALEYNKPLILVPRMKKFGEHIDDHQIQIAKELRKKGKAIVVFNIKYLGNVIQKIRMKKYKKTKKKQSKIIKIISNYISCLGDTS